MGLDNLSDVIFNKSEIFNKKNMKRILIVISGMIVIVGGLFVFKNMQKTNVIVHDGIFIENTISISRSYIALRLKTDDLLINAVEYSDYETWNTEMTELIENWQNLEEKASLLEEQAENYIGKDLSFNLIPEVYAFSKTEISDVFDKAPAGKKIRTLAKYLGVDAKRAFKILQNDQEFVKADAWNDAGNTFKELETSAIILKDGCKVLGYVGLVVATGGAAAGPIAAAGQATVIAVVGTDLILEISEDTATIALGDSNETTKYISKIRSDSYLEPAAAILSLTSAADASKGELIMIQAENLRSALQDKKILGVNIPSSKNSKSKKIEASSLTDEELDKWIEEIFEDYDGDKTIEDLDEWLEDFENLDEWLDAFEEEEDLIEEEEEVSAGLYDGEYSGALISEGITIPVRLTVVNNEILIKIISSFDFEVFEHSLHFVIDISCSGMVDENGVGQGSSNGTAVVDGGDDGPVTTFITGDFLVSFTETNVSLIYTPVVPDAESKTFEVVLVKE